MMTLDELDAALAKIPATPKTDADLDARAALMAKRCELFQAEKATAANSQPKPRGNLVVNVPAGAGLTHMYGIEGRTIQARVADDGRVVIDLFPQEFKSLLADRKYGDLFRKANHECLRRLG
jgi:hypothetical protein